MNDLSFEIYATYFTIGLCAGFVVSFFAWCIRRVIITTSKFF